MTFKPGNKANPLGRPKRRSPISEDYQAFYAHNKADLQKVFQKVIMKALNDDEPWAMKLCLEYFCPKPERSVAVTKEETKAVTMTMDERLKTWSLEDKQTFLKIWLKNKRGLPVFDSSGTSTVNEEGIVVEGEVIEEGKKDPTEG